MKEELIIPDTRDIQNKIITIRYEQIMIDRDLAELYGVETKVLNQAVKRNIDRFPKSFRFQLKDSEKNQLVTNCDRFKTLKHSSTNPYAFTKQGIFFDGQIFEANNFVSDLFRSADFSIVIIDNDIDDSVLIHLSKKKIEVKAYIFTRNINKQLKLDVHKFNEQYKNITLKKFNKSHDRFIILDDKIIYHFGASLKDLGKKWFAFSKFDKDALPILEKLEL